MNFLSDEILLRIFGFLKPRDLCYCSRVCSQWYRLANDSCLWKRLFILTYGKFITDRKKYINVVLERWKELFILKSNWFSGHCNVESLSYASTSASYPTLLSHSPVICLKISHCENSFLASVNERESKVQLWNLKEKTHINIIPCEGVVECLDFGTDRSVEILAIGLQNCKFCLWSNKTKKHVHIQNNNIPSPGENTFTLQEREIPILHEDAVCRINIQDNKLVTVTRGCVVRLWQISWTKQQVSGCLCLHILTTFKPRCSVLDIQLRRETNRNKLRKLRSELNFSKKKDIWVLCISYASEVFDDWNLIGCQMFNFHGSRLIEGRHEVPSVIPKGSPSNQSNKTHSHRESMEEMSSRTPISCLSISPCTSMVSSGQFDNTINLWETSSRSRRHTLFGHTGAVTCTHIDMHKVVSGSQDRKVKVWSLETGDCQLTLPGNHCSGVSSVTFNDQWVVSGDNSGEIKVWDFAVKSLSTLRSQNWKSGS